MKQLALPVLAAAGLIALLIVVFPAGSDDSTAPAPTTGSRAPEAPSFPSPPSGAVVFAREDGANALALAVSPNAVQASVVDPEGTGVSGLPLSLAVTTATGQVVRANGTPCGRGCYSAPAVTGVPRRVTVAVGRGAQQRRFQFVLPRTWPPPDATALVPAIGSSLAALEDARLARAPRLQPRPRAQNGLQRRGAEQLELPDCAWPPSGRDRHAPLGPCFTNGLLAALLTAATAGTARAVLECRSRRPRGRLGEHPRSAGLASDVLRSAHACLVQCRARQADAPYPRAQDGRDSALHASRLRSVQRAAEARAAYR